MRTPPLIYARSQLHREEYKTMRTSPLINRTDYNILFNVRYNNEDTEV